MSWDTQLTKTNTILFGGWWRSYLEKGHQMLPQKLRKQMAQGLRIHKNCCLSGISISRNFWITSKTMQTSTHPQPKHIYQSTLVDSPRGIQKESSNRWKPEIPWVWCIHNTWRPEIRWGTNGRGFASGVWCCVCPQNPTISMDHKHYSTALQERESLGDDQV